jgi:enolase-phosphatase E1
MTTPRVSAILTDIEGTTTSLSFVQEVLFPYGAQHLPEFVRRHQDEPEIKALLKEVSEIQQVLLDDEAAIAVLLYWITQDKKLAPLKALQGMIWEHGYGARDFFGHVYPDVPIVLQRWHEAGLGLYVFSSGSVYAQKLLFGHTEVGDLTGLFSGYFDTRTGPKKEAASYHAIAQEIGKEPKNILFLSDVGAELDAAQQAGMQTTQLLRVGTEPYTGHPHAENFYQIELKV